MSTDPARRPLTDALLAQLRTSGVTVGDGVLPTGDANWIGQPNLPSSTFKPFAVLSPLFAGDYTGAIGDSHSDWRIPYMIELFGVTRDQCEWVGDTLRGTANPLRDQVLTLGAAGDYKVQYVQVDSIGAPTRIEVADPPFWHAQDGLTLRIGRQRA